MYYLPIQIFGEGLSRKPSPIVAIYKKAASRLSEKILKIRFGLRNGSSFHRPAKAESPKVTKACHPQLELPCSNERVVFSRRTNGCFFQCFPDIGQSGRAFFSFLHLRPQVSSDKTAC